MGAGGAGPGEITDDDVLDAAMGLIREAGVAGLSMRRLAERLGTSYQVVYSRIGGKSDVVRAIHDRGFMENTASSDDLGTTQGTADHIHAVARHYLRCAMADPLLFELMFASPVPEFARDDDARAIEWEAFRRIWLAAVGTWLDTEFEERPPGTARRLAWRLWTAVHGIATVHLAGHASPGGDPEREVDAVVRLMLADPVRAGAP